MILGEKNGTHRRSIPSKKCVEGNQRKERILVLVGVKMCKGNLKDQGENLRILPFPISSFLFPGFCETMAEFHDHAFSTGLATPGAYKIHTPHISIFQSKKVKLVPRWMSHTCYTCNTPGPNPQSFVGFTAPGPKKGALLLGGS